MSDVSANNRRVAKNTIYLYFRMLLIFLVGLYTSRIVLSTLGISDYGLYNVVGGVVSIFAFLNATLSSSTQRFLTFELGTGDNLKLKRVFSTSLLIHILLIVFVLILAETVGLWFVKCKLNIEPGREVAALWVYQFSIIATCVQIFQLPFMSTLIAHEKMSIYAYISIIEVVAKLLIVYVLQVSSCDKLILYGFLYLIVIVLISTTYIVYCTKKFSEARISLKSERPLFKQMLSFSGWNLIGSVASVCNNQVINILFNLFFGTVVNAARGVAYQVYGMINQFASNFQVAVKPQVIKYYANGQMKEMKDLVFNSAKYSGFLLLFLSIPVFLEIDPLLSLWLGKYPDYTNTFVRIILCQMVITSMTGPLMMVVHASGYLKNVGITAGGMYLLVLPISYVCLKLGSTPIVPLIVYAIGTLIEPLLYLLWMNHYIGFPILDFYKEVYSKVLGLGLMMFIPALITHHYLTVDSNILRVLIVGCVSVICSGFVVLKWGIDESHRRAILTKLHLMK